MPTDKIISPQPATVLVGLIGKGIQLSRTPAMHENEGAAQGVAYEYRLLDIDEMGASPVPLAELLDNVERDGFCGLNITYPYKKEVMQHLDILSDEAISVDAVNTVVFHEGKRFGHNTDMWGFAESFRQNMEGAARTKVLQIGAGGAGGAVAHALLECGVETLSITDIDIDSANDLAKRLSVHFGSGRINVINDIAATVQNLDGVVNATPIGMAKSPGTAFPVEFLSPSLWVADIVYFPLETELLAQAKAKGCRVLPGSGMALFQAMRAFELFTGLEADKTRMKATFDAFDS